MDKVYRLLAWLDIGQAVDFLQGLTETPVTGHLLLQLCEARQCQAFADVDGLKGEDLMNREPATAIGIHLVTDPVDAFGSEWGPHTVHTEGDIQGGIAVEWKGELMPWKRAPIFRPADIEALAAKMNGEPGQPSTAEVEDLRQQLEQERAAREAAEAELLKRRSEDGKRTLEGVRQMLTYSHKEFAAMRERAEQAERMVASLDRQLTEQAEKKRIDDRAFKEMAKLLRKQHKAPQPDQSDEQATGLTFPYATKALEAMRAAVAKYWEGYTTDKRQPTQKEVAIELGELLGLPRQGSGDPARKAIALASAIKPDVLPDA